jgi:hypothetical protein
LHFSADSGRISPRGVCIGLALLSFDRCKVVTSAMGIRYAGLHHKSYSLFSEGLKLSAVCHLV